MEPAPRGGVPPASSKVSVIVVSWQDDPRVASCLRALASDGHDSLEVVLVENGAGPVPPKWEPEPAVRLRRPENPGYAAAVEDALARCTGDWILTLNPDTQLQAGSLARALTVLRSDSAVGAVAFRLVRPGGQVLDSAGIRLGWLRRARDRGMGVEAAGRYLEPADVDGACMACALFRRAALVAARDGAGETLDRRFFAYKEDVDLSWRLRRAGFRIRYVPEAVAEHERGWKEGKRREVPTWLRVLSLRNRWLTILKNERALALLARMALYVPVEVMVAGYLLLREPGVLRAYPQVIRALPETWRRRSLPRGSP